METALFWIIWGVICFWALKTFYYPFSKKKFEWLRNTALSINLSVLVLTFLPWLPPNVGGKSGIILTLEGNILAIFFLILLIISTILFLAKSQSNLKIASGITIVNTIILFALMIQIHPGTFNLTLFDIAPIIVALSLLISDVVVLLLWQQLNLKERK